MNNKYTIENEPVFYDGQWFRSKLEAKWYCFLLQSDRNYPVFYEPFKIGDWTPDFVVDCSFRDDSWIWLFEVKPYSFGYEFEDHRMYDVTCGSDIPFVKEQYVNQIKKNHSHLFNERFGKAIVGYCGDCPVCFSAPRDVDCDAACYWDHAQWPTSKDMGWL